MPLDFPSSPTNGQIYGDYVYDSTAGVWRSQATSNIYPVAISNGGTGANTLAGAQDNLRVGLIPITAPTVVASGAGSSASQSGMNIVTFSNCGDIRLQNIFTSAYRNYRIHLDISAVSATGGIAFRFITGSTVISTGYNYGGQYADAPGGTAFWGGEAQPQMYFGETYISSGSRFSALLDVFHPQVSTKNSVAQLTSWGVRADGAARGVRTMGEQGEVASRDGFMFFAGTGTFSGTITTYAYND